MDTTKLAGEVDEALEELARSAERTRERYEQVRQAAETLAPILEKYEGRTFVGRYWQEQLTIAVPVKRFSDAKDMLEEMENAGYVMTKNEDRGEDNERRLFTDDKRVCVVLELAEDSESCKRVLVGYEKPWVGEATPIYEFRCE